VDEVQSRLAEKAVGLASIYLKELPHNLYAAEVRRPHAVEWSRFRQHLGVDAPVLKWGAVVVVRLLPEVVESRRGRLKGAKRKHLRPVDPPVVENEDDEPHPG
jgi:hypothetical protein